MRNNQTIDNGTARGGADEFSAYPWLVIGVVMAGVGGTIKAVAVVKLPELFEYLFFSGPAYVLMASGLLIVVLAIGHGLLFGDQE